MLKTAIEDPRCIENKFLYYLEVSEKKKNIFKSNCLQFDSNAIFRDELMKNLKITLKPKYPIN